MSGQLHYGLTQERKAEKLENNISFYSSIPSRRTSKGAFKLDGCRDVAVRDYGAATARLEIYDNSSRATRLLQAPYLSVP